MMVQTEKMNPWTATGIVVTNVLSSLLVAGFCFWAFESVFEWEGQWKITGAFGGFLITFLSFDRMVGRLLSRETPKESANTSLALWNWWFPEGLTFNDMEEAFEDLFEKHGNTQLGTIRILGYVGHHTCSKLNKIPKADKPTLVKVLLRNPWVTWHFPDSLVSASRVNQLIGVFDRLMTCKDLKHIRIIPKCYQEKPTFRALIAETGADVEPQYVVYMGFYNIAENGQGRSDYCGGQVFKLNGISPERKKLIEDLIKWYDFTFEHQADSPRRAAELFPTSP